MEKGSQRALDELRFSTEAAPGVTLLKATHKTIFESTLLAAGKFHNDSQPAAPESGHEPRQTVEIEKQLAQLARKHESLRTGAQKESEQGLALNEGATVKKLANYHSELLRVKPFPDIAESNFINRTVALTVLESQIEHCFPAYKHENRKAIDAARYQQAVEWSHDYRDLPEKLQNVVKDLAGQPDNVHYLADHKKRHDDGHSH